VRHYFKAEVSVIRRYPCLSEEHGGGWAGSSTKIDKGAPSSSSDISIFHHGYRDVHSFFSKIDFSGEISYHTTSSKELKMAIHKSAVRQWRRSLRRNAINKKNKSAVRSQIKKLREAIKDKNSEEAQRLLPLTFSDLFRD
jgi:small subunit ribosomal protein S20